MTIDALVTDISLPIQEIKRNGSLLFPSTEIVKLLLIAVITAAANQMQIVVVVL